MTLSRRILIIYDITSSDYAWLTNRVLGTEVHLEYRICA